MPKKIIITEKQAKEIANIIAEELYAEVVNVGTFDTAQEAESFLAYIRQKYGFSKYDSYIKGTSVIVTIEKSQMDDSYYHDMIKALKGESANRYKRIIESKLTALIYNALNEALFDFSCWSTD